MTQWYYSVDGQNRAGPIAQEELTRLISSGRLNSQTLVFKEGMSEWVYASTVNDLFPKDSFPPLPTTSPYQNLSLIPAEIKGWNWGAFLLGGFWSIGNRVWIGLLSFIPYIGFWVKIYLGIKGNELAWKNKRWNSIEQFKSAQRKWAIAGLVVLVLFLLLLILIGIGSS
jgi:hypothetical protein